MGSFEFLHRKFVFLSPLKIFLVLVSGHEHCGQDLGMEGVIDWIPNIYQLLSNMYMCSCWYFSSIICCCSSLASIAFSSKVSKGFHYHGFTAIRGFITTLRHALLRHWAHYVAQYAIHFKTVL